MSNGQLCKFSIHDSMIFVFNGQLCKFALHVNDKCWMVNLYTCFTCKWYTCSMVYVVYLPYMFNEVCVQLSSLYICLTWSMKYVFNCQVCIFALHVQWFMYLMINFLCSPYVINGICSMIILYAVLHVHWYTHVLTLYLIETSFYTGPRSYKSCLIRVYSVCLWNYNKIWSYTGGPDK